MAGDMNRWMQMLTALQAMRGLTAGGPESSITTHEQQEKRGEAARSNAVNVGLGGALMVAGVGLHLGGWLLATGYTFAVRGVVVGIPLYLGLAALPAAIATVKFSRRDETGAIFYPVPFKWSYVTMIAITWFLSFGVLSFLNHEVPEWQSTGGLILAALGPVLTVAGWFLAFNGAQNLRNPYGWRSPAEEEISKPIALAITRMIEGMTDDQPAPTIVQGRALPVHNNHGRRLVGTNGDDDAVDARPDALFEVDPEQTNLVFFGLLAAGVQSLSYRQMTRRTLTLPGIEDGAGWNQEPRTLTEDTWRDLIVRGASAEWDWWTAAAARRSPGLNFDSWDELREAAEEVWATASEGRLPLPDPFGGEYHVNAKAPYRAAA